METSKEDISHRQILPYDPEWVHLYENEAEKIKNVFGGDLLGIEHIGSTSIPGLSSKPIIDIMVLIESHENAEKFFSKLNEIGYPFNFDAHTDKSTERHLFRKGNPTRFHLSIAYLNRGGFWKRQIAFRDYLRSHLEEIKRYEELKHYLIKADPTGKGGYISGKTDFVNEILNKAAIIT